MSVPARTRQAIRTDQAPAAIGPYSQAVMAGPLLFASGQIPIDPATGQVVDGDVAAQTDRVLRNLESVLAAAGLSEEEIAAAFGTGAAHAPQESKR